MHICVYVCICYLGYAELILVNGGDAHICICMYICYLGYAELILVNGGDVAKRIDKGRQVHLIREVSVGEVRVRARATVRVIGER